MAGFGDEWGKTGHFVIAVIIIIAPIYQYEHPRYHYEQQAWQPGHATNIGN